MGGVGKTETALEYAYRHLEAFDAAFWINAEDESERVKSFSRVGKREGVVSEDNVADDATVERTRDWLESTDIRWLVIFDNVASYSDVASLVPSTTHGTGSLLLTSQLSGLASEQIPKVAIDPFDHQAGITLLLEHINSRSSDKEQMVDVALAARITELVDVPPRIAQATDI